MDVMIQRSSSEEDVKVAKDSRDQYEACLSKAFVGYKPEDMKATSCDCVAICVCERAKDFVLRAKEACEQSAGSVEVGRQFS